MKKKKKLLKILLIIIGIYFLANISTFINKNVNTYMVNGIVKKLKTGQTLYVNYWNEIEQDVNDKKIKGIVKTYNGIGIGTSKNKVIRRFNLDSSNAEYNCEIDPYGDGETDIITGRFTKSIFDNKYLDCYVSFGYRNGRMLKYDEIIKLKDSSDVKKGTTIYNIDFNGFRFGELVGKGRVIAFNVTRY